MRLSFYIHSGFGKELLSYMVWGLNRGPSDCEPSTFPMVVFNMVTVTSGTDKRPVFLYLMPFSRNFFYGTPEDQFPNLRLYGVMSVFIILMPGQNPEQQQISILHFINVMLTMYKLAFFCLN